jgi:hypothetical protein
MFGAHYVTNITKNVSVEGVVYNLNSERNDM